MELPHVVAPAVSVINGQEEGIEAGGYSFMGTTASASIVGGIASLVFQKNNRFIGKPELSRAVIMASSWEDVDGTGRLNLTDSVDDKDGVGEASAARAVRLADYANKVDGNNTPRTKGFDYGTMDFSTQFRGGWYNEVYKISLPPYTKVQAVLAWASTSTCTDYNSPSCSSATDTLDADLDLYLYEGATLRASSTAGLSAYEYVYYENNTRNAKTLDLKVYKCNPASSTYFGIAWDVLENESCVSNADYCGPAQTYSERTVYQVPNQDYSVVYPVATRLSTGEWLVGFGEGVCSAPTHANAFSLPINNDRSVFVWQRSDGPNAGQNWNIYGRLYSGISPSCPGRDTW